MAPKVVRHFHQACDPNGTCADPKVLYRGIRWQLHVVPSVGEATPIVVIHSDATVFLSQAGKPGYLSVSWPDITLDEQTVADMASELSTWTNGDRRVRGLLPRLPRIAVFAPRIFDDPFPPRLCTRLELYGTITQSGITVGKPSVACIDPVTGEDLL